MNAYETQAYEMGVEAAKSAASWTLDGNTDPAHIARILDMLDAGDPCADDYLPARPDLSGEWADAPTPQSLYEEITGRELPMAGDEGLSFETEHGSLMDALCDAYEQGVLDTFEPECERILRAALPEDDVPHVGHFSRLGGTWWCDTCNSPYCDLA